MALPPALLRTAAHQLALFSGRQAREHQVTQAVLDGMVRRGELERPHRGVFAIPGVTWTWDRRLLAVCLAGGPGTVGSHRSGAVLWELLDLDDAPLEVTAGRPRSPRFAVEASPIIHRPLDLTPQQVTVRHGVPVTNPLRTVVDLAGVVVEDVLVDAIDAGVALKLFTVKAIDAMRRRLAKPGRPGPGRLRPVLEAEILGDRARTVLEARMARLWRRFGLPPFTFQYVVRDRAGRFVARPDFAISELKIAIEVDGWQDHGSPTATARDHRRRNKLLANGWIVVTFTWNQVKYESARVASDIRDAISARLAAS